MANLANCGASVHSWLLLIFSPNLRYLWFYTLAWEILFPWNSCHEHDVWFRSDEKIIKSFFERLLILLPYSISYRKSKNHYIRTGSSRPQLCPWPLVWTSMVPLDFSFLIFEMRVFVWTMSKGISNSKCNGRLWLRASGTSWEAPGVCAWPLSHRTPWGRCAWLARTESPHARRLWTRRA